MIATPHALASEAGLAVFRQGGNAVAAAIAAAITLAVVYPHMNRAGGDGFRSEGRCHVSPLCLVFKSEAGLLGRSERAIRGPMYGNVYGMRRTTIYLPDDLKRALEQIATARGCSEAALVREAIWTLTAGATPPRPRLPLFRSGKPTLAEQVDTALAGFGHR